MSYSVDNTSIKLTRGDTFKAHIILTDSEGNTYEPTEGDSIRFALKKAYRDKECLIQKEIPIDTLLLKLEPEDTKHLNFGDYVYDIELTKANGDVDTFITKAKLTLTEEVY